MNSRVTIREAQAADYPHIERILADASLPLSGLNGHHDFLVLCLADRIVGCAAMERYQKFALLRSVALDARQRRRGIRPPPRASGIAASSHGWHL